MISSNESSPQLSPPRTFFCYWDWCRLIFSTVDELASHVRHNHIWKLQPMHKHEITRMRRQNAEEAQSMSGSLGSSVPVCHHEGPSRLTCTNSADQGSPASRSLDLSQAHTSQALSTGPPTPPTTHHSTSPFQSERTSPAIHGVDLHQDATLQTTPARRGFPHFAQLSSPADTSSIASLPRSPDMSTLSLRPNIATQIDAFDRRHSRLIEVTQGERPLSLRHSCSQSSCSSQEAVERQLTQDDVMDVSVQIKKPEADQNGTTEGAALSTSEAEDPAAMFSGLIADADADLQWPESEPELTPANQPRPLSPPVVGEEAEQIEYCSSSGVLPSDRWRTFRSGTLHISPLLRRTEPILAPQPSQIYLRERWKFDYAPPPGQIYDPVSSHLQNGVPSVMSSMPVSLPSPRVPSDHQASDLNLLMDDVTIHVNWPGPTGIEVQTHTFILRLPRWYMPSDGGAWSTHRHR
ncbi:hypothetical protein M405DRAFT_812511 [Rhizopogon salebrosus TDB-379]|nr:hypothetical protein M405DRAFT_812511 [Rhizopogon salebrosus TDB-379]